MGEEEEQKSTRSAELQPDGFLEKGQPKEEDGGEDAGEEEEPGGQTAERKKSCEK